MSDLASNLAELAPDRTAQHNGAASQRVLSRAHDKVGLAGEFAFGEWCGLWPDTAIKPGGDQGIDFKLPLMFTVDVKTARNPHSLLQPASKRTFADIYVLVGYDEATGKTTLIGWEWGRVLTSTVPYDTGCGIINYCIPANKLHPMSELRGRLLRFA